MGPGKATSNSNGHGLGRRKRSEGPFPHFERGRRQGQGWTAIDLGGHEVVAHLRMDMRPGPEAAGEGRHSLDRLEGAIDDETLDNLRLLVTELVTNSVRHGGAEDWIQLDVEIYANTVRVAVRDRGPGFRPPETPQPHPDRPGGWGLCLVDRLADRWGVTRDGRTQVWFEIDRGHERRFAATTG
jgi:anti-sigma regulatory factor (Ser/Thr protein kinase)